jgi:glycosyltransferase involved in cell wall biosynthesis
MSSAIYATYGYTTHDLRFVDVLLDRFEVVHYLRFDAFTHDLVNSSLPDEVRQVEWLGTKTRLTRENLMDFVEAFASIVADLDTEVILAGPVPSVGFICSRQKLRPVVLLSWASDLLIDIDHFPEDKLRAIDALCGSAGVVVDCATVAAVVQQFGVLDSQICTVPWGINLEDFTPGARRKPDGVFRILSLRSLEEVYDVETLIRAAQLLGDADPAFDFKISIVGDGTQRTELQRLATLLGVQERITWVNRIEEKQVRSVLLSHDLYISTARSDGSSISMLQAMACGQPVLVADLKSNAEWIKDGRSGWLFNVGSPTHLSEKIQEVAKHYQDELIQTNALQLILERADWLRNKPRIASFIEKCRQ